MKFVKLKARKSTSYFCLESNNINLIVLGNFLAYECYSRFDKYINWIKLLPEDSNEFSYSGEHFGLFNECNFMNVKAIYYSDEIEDPTYKFVSNKYQILDILLQWRNILGRNPFKLDNAALLPQDILITQDHNNYVQVEAIAHDDPRFSRLIKNNNQSFVTLEKSNIFDNYYSFNSNDKKLFLFGALLSEYCFKPSNITYWLNIDNDFYPARNLSTGYFQDNMLKIESRVPSAGFEHNQFSMYRNQIDSLIQFLDKALEKKEFPVIKGIKESNQLILSFDDEVLKINLPKDDWA